jgi:hypothetical protein
MLNLSNYGSLGFGLAIAADLDDNFDVVHEYGSVTIAESDTWEDVWSQGGSYTFQSSAVTLGVSSASTDDDAEGTGARTLEIRGLDANYARQTETITLDGQTKVESTKQYIRVLGAKVLTAGSGGINAGKLYIYDTSDTVTDGVPQTASKIMAVIDADYGQAQMAIYTVPAGYTGFMIARNISLSQRANQYCDVELMVRPFGGAWLHKTLDGFALDPSPLGRTFPVPRASDFNAKADIRYRTRSSATGGVVAVEFDFLLVNSDLL